MGWMHEVETGLYLTHQRLPDTYRHNMVTLCSGSISALI